MTTETGDTSALGIARKVRKAVHYAAFLVELAGGFPTGNSRIEARPDPGCTNGSLVRKQQGQLLRVSWPPHVSPTRPSTEYACPKERLAARRSGRAGQAQRGPADHLHTTRYGDACQTEPPHIRPASNPPTRRSPLCTARRPRRGNSTPTVSARRRAVSRPGTQGPCGGRRPG